MTGAWLVLAAGLTAADDGRKIVVEALPAFVLRGHARTVDIPIERTPRSHPKSVRLDVRIPDAVQRKVSWLAVAIDDRPLASVRLDRPKQRVRVVLPKLQVGFHRLRVTARLASSELPCTPDEEALVWLRAKASLTRSVESEPPKLDITDASDFFRDLARPIRIGVAQMEPTTTSTAVDLAVLRAAVLVRQWGLEPAFDPGPVDIELRVDRDLSPQLCGRIDADAGAIKIAGRSPTCLLRTVEALSMPRFRSRCGEAACLLARSACSATGACVATTLAKDEESPTDRLATLRKAGLPRGWSVSGVGHHRLVVPWAVDPSHRFEGQARWHLEIDVGGLELTHPHLSSLTVRVDDQPVASWALGRLESGLNILTVPIRKKLDGTTMLEILVQFEPVEDWRCRALPKDSIWLRVSPDSGVEVQRFEDERLMLRNALDRGESESLKVGWAGRRPGHPGLLSAVLLQWLPSSSPYRWDFAADARHADIWLSEPSELPDIGFESTELGLVDVDSRFGLPVLTGPRLLAVAYARRPFLFLYTWPGSSHGDLPASFEGDAALGALSDIGWTTFGEGPVLTSQWIGTPKQTSTVVVSDEAIKWTTIHGRWLVVAGGLILLVALFLMWEARAARRASVDPNSIEALAEGEI